jgi:hypothetical protein
MRIVITQGFAAILLMLTMVSGRSTAAQCQALPIKVEHAIQEFVTKVRGAEYCQYRKLAQGDLSGAGTQDVAVVFHVEGSCDDDKESPPGSCGNHADTYLEVFLEHDQAVLPLLRIVSPNEAAVKQLRIEHGKIIANVSGPREDVQSGRQKHPQVTFIVQTGVVVKEAPPSTSPN